MKAIEMTTTNSAIGRPGKNFSPNHNTGETSEPDARDHWMHLEKLAGDRKPALDEVVPTTGNAEQSGNLRYGNRYRICR
jgi:hypothetical protein